MAAARRRGQARRHRVQARHALVEAGELEKARSEYRSLAQKWPDSPFASAAEAREKLAKGMAILIREGSVSKDLNALAEVLDANCGCHYGTMTNVYIAYGGLLDALWDGRMDGGARAYDVSDYRWALASLVAWTAMGLFASLFLRETHCRPVQHPPGELH